MMEMGDKPMRNIVLTWTDVDRLIDMLVPQIRSLGSYDGMIMITRGGVIPGGMLAEALSIHHLLTAAVDFPAKAASIGLMAMPSFIQFPEISQLKDRKLLIVDDVWGSGRTSISVRERVVSAGGVAFNCVLHFNPYRSLFTKASPDFYADTTKEYIIYPWEIDRGMRGIPMGMPEAN
jgi:uncharacterized protein